VITLEPDDYVDFGYWLNHGSTIQATFSSRQPAWMYVFQGDAAFSRWEDDSDATEGLVRSSFSSNGRPQTMYDSIPRPLSQDHKPQRPSLALL